MRLRTAVFLLIGLAFTSSLYAQTTGRIIGTVRDSSRGVLPGTTITATSTALPGGPMTTTSNEQGEYQFINLPPGIYTVTVELSGFAGYKEEDLQVTAGGTVERNVALSVGSVAETITVSGEAPIVDTRRAGIAHVQPVEVIESIPLERRAQTDYVARLPGATASSYNATNGVNIMGSGTSEIAMTQDGAGYNNAISGGSYAIADVDNVQEVSVTMLGASAEYAQAQGGVMNVITKSGTNQFRGDARYYNLLKGSSAEPISLPCTNRANPGSVCTDGATTAFKWFWNPDHSAHGGGPIVHDRLWYFFGGTKVGWQFRQPGTDTQPVKDTYQRYDDRLSGKVSWKASDKITVNQTGLYEWWQYLSSFPTVTQAPENLAWYPGDIRLSGTELNWILTSTTVLAAHFTYYAQPTSFIGMGPNLSKSDITTPGIQDSTTSINTGGYYAGNSSQVPWRKGGDVKISKYLSSDSMTHNIRAGFQFNNSFDTEQRVYSGGIRYAPQNGVPNQAQVSPASQYTGATKTQGVWVEDELNLWNRLTILPGVRFDHTVASSPDSATIDGSQLVKNGTPAAPYYTFPETSGIIPGLGTLYTWNTFSPRVGANLKLTEDGRTVVRGTVGRYYRPAFINDFLSSMPGIPTVTTVRCTTCGVAGTDPTTVTYPTVVSVVNPTANLKVDPNTKAPYTDSFSIGFDREIGRNMGVSVSFAHKLWQDQLGSVDIGGTYDNSQPVVTTIGTTINPYRRTSAATSSIFQLTNAPRQFQRYNGLVTSFTKRMSNRWMAGVGYTYSKSTQLNYGNDPNSEINAEGPPRTVDRPHVTDIQATYLIPIAEVQVATNLTLASGQPYGATQQFALPQGNTNIFIQAPGTYRTPFQRYMMLRISRKVKLGPNQADLIAEFRNLLNEESDANVQSTVLGASNFGIPGSFAYPRRVYLGLRYNFR